MAEQLQTFKIGDKVGRPGVKREAAPAAPPAEEKNTAGFPRVEALIDEYQNADQAKEVFGESIANIEGMLAAEKNPKKKADLARAKLAFEHTVSTLDYLFQVKNEIAQSMIVSAPAAKNADPGNPRKK